MSKSMIIIDTPINCEECPFIDDMDYTCGVFNNIFKESYTYVVPEGERPDWCPLKEVVN